MPIRSQGNEQELEEDKARFTTEEAKTIILEIVHTNLSRDDLSAQQQLVNWVEKKIVDGTETDELNLANDEDAFTRVGLK